MDELGPEPGLDLPGDALPIGAQAAAQEVLDAPPAPPPGALVPAPLAQFDFSSLARPMIAVGVGFLESKAPEWKANDRELDALGKAWGDYLATVMSAPTPLAAALLVTGMFAAPRVLTIQARKKREKRDARKAEDDPSIGTTGRAGRFGLRQEPLVESVGGQATA